MQGGGRRGLWEEDGRREGSVGGRGLEHSVWSVWGREIGVARQ